MIKNFKKSIYLFYEYYDVEKNFNTYQHVNTDAMKLRECYQRTTIHIHSDNYTARTPGIIFDTA